MKTFQSVSQLKLASLSAGQRVSTRSYYNNSASDTAGAALYLILTPAEFGGTPDEFGDHTLANGNIAVLQIEDGNFSLLKFGGVLGTDTANAAINAASLSAAIGAASSGSINSFEGGRVIVENGEWVIDRIILNEQWGWNLDFNNNQVTFTGEFIIRGCAGFTISNLFCNPSVNQAHDFIRFELGTTTGERVHNFKIENVSPENFDVGIHAVADTSQCWICKGQFTRNQISISFPGGFTSDHVLFEQLIFGTHNPGQVAFDVRTNNWRLTRSHFETLNDATINNDVEARGQAFEIHDNLFFRSGRININANNGKIINNTIINTSSDVAINLVSGEVDVCGNTIRWDVNTGAGDTFTDGTGKTGISGSPQLCSNNIIKRSGKGIVLDGSRLLCSDNRINDAVESGIELTGVPENCQISQNYLQMTKATATALVNNGAGASDNVVWNRNIVELSNGAAYSSFTPDRQTVITQGTGSPEGVIFGGPGSIYSQVNGGAGTSLWVKETIATSNTGWKAL